MKLPDGAAPDQTVRNSNNKMPSDQLAEGAGYAPAKSSGPQTIFRAGEGK